MRTAQAVIAPPEASAAEVPPSPGSVSPTSANNVADMMNLRVHEAAPVQNVPPVLIAPPVVEETPYDVPASAPEIFSAPQTPYVTAEEREAIAQEKINLASSLMKEKRWQESIVVIESGLAANPRSIPLWYLLSEGLYKNGEYDRAMEAVNKALVIIHGGSN